MEKPMVSPKQCGFCGEVTLPPVTRFMSLDGPYMEALPCPHCFALNLQEEGASPEALSPEEQASFHEQWWKWEMADRELLMSEARELKQLVDSLLLEVGAISDDECLIEIGTGKGSMLCAFRSAGVAAFGCDASAKLCEIANQSFNWGEQAAFHETADVFLNRIIEDEGRVSGRRVRAVVAWHSLEHIAGSRNIVKQVDKVLPPDGVLMVQLPGLAPSNVMTSHLYLTNKRHLSGLTSGTDLKLQKLSVDVDNMFMTGIFKKSDLGVDGGFETSQGYDGIDEAIRLRNEHLMWMAQLLKERQAGLEEQAGRIHSMEQELGRLVNAEKKYRRVADELGKYRQLPIVKIWDKFFLQNRGRE